VKTNPKAFGTLRDARKMQAALGFLITAHLTASEKKLPGSVASGVQTLHWHIGDTLSAALWQLAPERQAGPPSVHTHGSEEDTLAALLHLMAAALREEVSDCRPAGEIGAGLSLLTEHFTRLAEEQRLEESEQRRACWLLLQRIAAGEDVDRADFEAVGIKSETKGGAR
jgi:hypothetical protein